jgi:alcohol dehydrogenase (cytochrome c)
MRCLVNRTGVASVTLLAAASLAAAGCASSTSSSSVAGCSGKQAGAASTAPASPGVAAGWTLPGGDMQNTRDVASTITSANVAAGKLLWYYQLTPHDLYDWDLQNSPVLTTANGQQVVIDGGKAGILIELNAQTGKLIWKLPVGVHSGPQNAGLLTENATPTSRIPLPATFELEPGVFGGVESQLATNGTTVFAAVNNLAVPMSVKGVTDSSTAFEAAIAKATGEMIAVSQDTGKVIWADQLPSSPYGAATVTNNVVFTTTYSGYLYAFNAATGAILLKTPLSSGSNAPVAVDGDYVIAGAGVPSLSKSQHALIIAYKLGAKGGKLPSTVGS